MEIDYTHVGELVLTGAVNLFASVRVLGAQVSGVRELLAIAQKRADEAHDRIDDIFLQKRV